MAEPHEEHDEETGEQPVPTARQVAERAIALKFVAVHAMTAPPRELLAEWMANWSRAEQERFKSSSRKERDEFLRKLGRFERALSASETAFLATTAATMSRQQQVNASWRSEALAVLAWALGALETLPPYDQGTDLDDLADFPPLDREAFVASAVLRPAEEIEQARDLAELWHWRSRTRRLTQDGAPLEPFPGSPEIRSYDDIVRMTARSAARAGDLVVIDEDFGVLGKAYRALSDEEWSGIASITMERHYTLNWLCGHAPGNDWDATPTPT